MIPDPVELQSADVCRDGGTYVAHYLDRKGDFFELELPVITDTVDGRWGAVGYRAPIQKSYDSSMHGQVMDEKQLTWEEALGLREKLLILLTDDVELGGRRRAEEMFDLLVLKGALPK